MLVYPTTFRTSDGLLFTRAFNMPLSDTCMGVRCYTFALKSGGYIAVDIHDESREIAVFAVGRNPELDNASMEHQPFDGTLESIIKAADTIVEFLRGDGWEVIPKFPDLT